MYTIAIDALGYEFDGAFYKNLTPDTIIFVSYNYNNVEDAKKKSKQNRSKRLQENKRKGRLYSNTLAIR